MKSAPYLFALSLSLAACGGDPSGGGADGAYLSIDGDANIFMEPGSERGLSVKYHDGQGNPLVGEVRFEVVGMARGSTINKDYGATDVEGAAKLSVFAAEQEAVFRVKASAEYATSVEWTVSVSEPIVREMDIRGRYEVDSDFDLVGVIPGPVGSAIDMITDISDGPNDPATYILDEILDGQSGVIADAANALRPGLDAVLNDAITDNAPDIVNDLLGLGNDLDQVAHKFGILTIMDIAGDSIEQNNVNATHEIAGMSFELDNMTHEYSMDELGASNATASNIAVVRDPISSKLTVAEHYLPVQYGQLLALALEDIIIPAIDPSVTSLAEFLSLKADCTSVGEALADNIPLPFGASFYDTACEVAVEAVASEILERIRDLGNEGEVNLFIEGTTIMKDPNGDDRADKMDAGMWNGYLDYKSELSSLQNDANPFTGSRSTDDI